MFPKLEHQGWVQHIVLELQIISNSFCLDSPVAFIPFIPLDTSFQKSPIGTAGAQNDFKRNYLLTCFLFQSSLYRPVKEIENFFLTHIKIKPKVTFFCHCALLHIFLHRISPAIFFFFSQSLHFIYCTLLSQVLHSRICIPVWTVSVTLDNLRHKERSVGGKFFLTSFLSAPENDG